VVDEQPGARGVPGLERRYYVLAIPEAVDLPPAWAKESRDRVAVYRSALEVLRTSLSLLWLDVRPIGGAWPDEVSGSATELAGRPRVALVVEQPGAPAAGRRGTGTDTVLLYPVRDLDFQLALALAPFSSAVEGISARGQLLFARRRGLGELRLYLSEAEHDLIEAAVPNARLSLLAQIDDDGNGRVKEERSAGSLVWGVVVGLVALGSGVPDLWHGPFWSWLGSLVQTVAGIAWFVISVRSLAGVVRTRLRRSGRNGRGLRIRPKVSLNQPDSVWLRLIRRRAASGLRPR
jgi:hypothetical protein